MKRIVRIFISFIMIFQLAAGSFCSVSAVSDDVFLEKFTSTAEHLKTIAPQVGSIGGEWMVLGLARADLLTEAEKEAYYQTVEEYVCGIGSEKLHPRKSTDNSRVVIALSAIGRRADNVAGFNLIAPLTDFSYVSKQGLNGIIWALLALDTCDYPMPKTASASRERLLEAILSAQCADGGWSMDSDASDPDMTGMAIQALAPYRFYDASVMTAINNALGRLIALQQTDGGYSSYDDFNPESCAQVITALTSLGILPQSDVRFAKSGKSLTDSMLRFSVPGGFAHTMGLGYNQMATEQAFYSMTACLRLQNGKTSLYSMQDTASYRVVDVDGDQAEGINDATELQRYLAEYGVILTAPEQCFADLDGDGAVTINDVTMLQRRLAQ